MNFLYAAASFNIGATSSIYTMAVNRSDTGFKQNFFIFELCRPIRVDILNPKAVRLLQDLADLDLISIKQISVDNFLKVINKLRSKADNPPSLEEITKEVEAVRAKRYTRNKG